MYSLFERKGAKTLRRNCSDTIGEKQTSRLCAFAPLRLKKSYLWALLIAVLFQAPLLGGSGGALLAQSGGAVSQTVIVGQVLDKYDKLPLASVNVYFKNASSNGTATSEEGYFLLRSGGDERVLVFSSIGYRTKELKIKPGQSAFITMELEEQNTMLQDLFVLPGVNPALEWMKRIRLVRKENDLTNDPAYEAESVEQSLVLLSKLEGTAGNKRLFEQLQKGNLSTEDSSLVVPLYMAESKYTLTSKGKTETAKNIFSTPEKTDHFVMQLSQGVDPELNFYHNAVTVFGKSLISPLANISGSYYDYYLADSLSTDTGKQYEIHFRTKNPKNLAFNGMFRFDSASLALTYIEATLPRKANINYVRDLTVKQEFEAQPGNRWSQKNVELAMNMTYDVIEDSVHRRPELFIRQSSDITLARRLPATASPGGFAQSEYSTETLDARMKALDDTPLMRTAKWFADVALTSYARVGWVDFGRLQNVMRLTDLEGFRLAVPLRTNEHLWKNISLGGQVGYGFREKKVKFSAFGQFRLPTEKRQVFELRYTDDNRRVDYDYNSYLRRESPWDQGDEDIVSTLLSFMSGKRISPRREWSLSYARDWNRNIESTLYLRANELFSNNVMPMSTGGADISSFRQQSLTVSTRFSFGEKKYEDHLQRIYIQNLKPVIYATAEAGRYNVSGQAGYYGKLIASMKQHVSFAIGDWNYMIEAGWLFGSVPYPLLEFSSGNEPSGIAFYQFNRMKYMEFAHDKYLQMNHEFVFNGLIFNHIPLVKHLNMREMIAVKAVVGGLSDRHREVLDFPDLPHYLHRMQNPYVEASIGVTNVLRIFTFQFNYRFTNNYEGITPGRFSFGLRFGF